MSLPVNKIIRGDWIEVLKTLPDNMFLFTPLFFYLAHIVKLVQRMNKRFSLFDLCTRNTRPSRAWIMTFSAFVYFFSQQQKNFGLWAFNPEKWIYCLYKRNSLFTTQTNSIKRLSVYSRRFIDSIIATKMLMNKLNSIRMNLFYTNPFLICWICRVFAYSDRISITLDCKKPICIHNASYPCECRIFHNYSFLMEVL